MLLIPVSYIKLCFFCSQKSFFVSLRHDNPLKNPAQIASYWGKDCLKRKVFDCLWKDSKDGASLASCGKEFQSLGAATEKALSCVHLRHTCEGCGRERKPSPDDWQTMCCIFIFISYFTADLFLILNGLDINTRKR